MHPAFSVIFFTAVSGAGYGLWFWLGLAAASDTPLPRMPSLAALALGFICVSAGLLSSTWHLGQPQRAWRAFSQWRSSWLSREGVAALLCFVPMLWLAAAIWRQHDTRNAGLLLAALSLLTVVCTGMIYVSLKPIPAWRHRLVLPGYLSFAAFTGGLPWLAIRTVAGADAGHGTIAAVLSGALLLSLLKLRYWRDIDRAPLPVARNSALGLPADRTVHGFERPHTEANYLTREMGFVLARKHASRLRLLALSLFALVPALCALPAWFAASSGAASWLTIAALSALLGAFIERWLFFAQAKHLVTLYY